MAIPDHLTCLLRNLCAGQEATVRTGHGTTDWFQIRRGVHQSCTRKECWSGLQFPTPGDLPDPGIDPVSVASLALAGGFFTTVAPGKLCIVRSIAQMPTFPGTCFQLTWSILQFSKKKTKKNTVVYSVCSIPLNSITLFSYVVRSVIYLSLI